jgi:hypothetical protein
MNIFHAWEVFGTSVEPAVKKFKVAANIETGGMRRKRSSMHPDLKPLA